MLHTCRSCIKSGVSFVKIVSDSKLEHAINLFDPQTGKSRPATDHKTSKIKRVELEPCRLLFVKENQKT